MVCGFTGHRPDKLYGYNILTKDYKRLSNILYDICKDLVLNKNIDEFISGGALGLDTIAFITINRLKKEFPYIKNTLALPFKLQYTKWKQADIDRYFKMEQIADKVIYVDLLDDYKIKGYESDIYYPAKMNKRNEFMVDKSIITVAVWNGTKGGTYNCIKYAEKKNQEIIIIKPDEIWNEVYGK